LSQDAMLAVHSSRANTTRRASDAAMLTAPLRRRRLTSSKLLTEGVGHGAHFDLVEANWIRCPLWETTTVARRRAARSPVPRSYYFPKHTKAHGSACLFCS